MLGAGWSHDTELLAVMAELIDANTRLHYEINKKKGERTQPPIRIPRPWHRKKKRRKATLEETQAMLGGPTIRPRKKEG